MLVSETVRTGANAVYRFGDRGVHELKGVPGTRQLAHAGCDRTDFLAAGADHDVGPCQIGRVELVRDMVACVDANLPQRLENLWVGGGTGVAARAARPVTVTRNLAEEPLGNDAAAAVPDAYEEDIHACADP